MKGMYKWVSDFTVKYPNIWRLKTLAWYHDFQTFEDQWIHKSVQGRQVLKLVVQNTMRVCLFLSAGYGNMSELKSAAVTI